MNRRRFILEPLILFLLFLLLAFVSEQFIINHKFQSLLISNFQKKIISKEKLATKVINDLAQKLVNQDSLPDPIFYEKLKYLDNIFEKEEITFLIFKNDNLLYWSDNITGLNYIDKNVGNSLVKLPNSYNYFIEKKLGNLSIQAFILIKYNYKIQNDFLENNFAKSLKIPNNFIIVEGKSDISFPIKNISGNIIFSLQHTGSEPCIYNLIFIPVFFFLLSFVFLFILFFRVNSHLIHRNSSLKSLVLLVFLSAIYLIMNKFQIPTSLYSLKLFSPQYFAYTFLWTSLGEFLIFFSFFLYWSINFYRSFDISDHKKKNKQKRRFYLFFFLLLTGLFLMFIRFLIQVLIMNSGISFAVYRIEDLNFYTVLGYLSLGILYYSFILLSSKIIQIFRKYSTAAEFFIIIILIFVLLHFALLFYNSGQFRLSVVFVLVNLILYYANKVKILSHKLSVTVLLVILFTLFTLFNVINFVKNHENKIQETMAINMSSEHDPNAELFLRDVDVEICSDTNLVKIAARPFDNIENYLIKNFFGGYFRDYEIQVTLCEKNDSLIITPENTTYQCIPFFNNMLEKNGSEIQGTNFFFMENSTGRISYLGKYELFPDSLKDPVNIFIELNSKLLSEGTGFPELLLPHNSPVKKFRNHFSFAKYYNGELVDRGGNFLYALSNSAYSFSEDPLSVLSFGGYEHVIYHKSDNNYVVVSREEETIFDYMISFPYIFVFLFIIAMIANALSMKRSQWLNKDKSLRDRIQLSIIGIVLTSLLIIGGGTIFYIISQYRSNHRKDLIDRINSVSIELESSVNKTRNSEQRSLEIMDFELIRISDVFKTDINIYDPFGYLMATSRPEIFEKGLVLPVMNKDAYKNMIVFNYPIFLNDEHIAAMDFMSAYLPLLDSEGNITGYLNLPYFTREKEFRQEITTFILAFINIYVFLLLASIIIAWFISSKITDPLKLIRENLRGVQLGKNPKPIHYKENDEIGILVSEYNHKVEELAASAELLARSERESAWREMAKQIAHEIKNPLTPMKLNIQFLQRSNPKTMEDYDVIVKKVTDTLVEQIDNLSTIATEFSNFAKMPKAHNEKFNLVNKLREIIDLYDYTGESEFVTNFNGCESVVVYADKEQFSRAMINLIRNALQSIPEQKKGVIKIEIERSTTFAIVKVTDNGKGIPENLRDSIFMPNFTTKTSGAGLGLAITKNIVENFKGEIWFTSEIEKGSTFFISIPFVED